MVGEKLGTDTQLLVGIVALAVRGERREARLGARARSAILSGFSQAVGLVIGAPGRHQRLHHPVALEIMERAFRSEEHTSELQSLMRISYAVFCLKKKKK